MKNDTTNQISRAYHTDKHLLTKKIGPYKLHLNPDDHHEAQYFWSKYHIDSMLASHFIKPNFQVADIGANIGFCALHYLKCGAVRVDAFEPETSLFTRLNSLQIPKLHVHNIAITDNNGTGKLRKSQLNNQGHTLEDQQIQLFSKIFGETEDIQMVQNATLDQIYHSEGLFDYIKMDIEGSEWKALKGGPQFFRNNINSILQIEIFNIYRNKCIEEISKYYQFIYKIVHTEKFGVFYLTRNIDHKPVSPFIDRPPNYICTNQPLTPHQLIFTDWQGRLAFFLQHRNFKIPKT